MTHAIVQLIDKAVEDDNAKQFPFRPHLGGSMIGRKCHRQIWYGFRWAKRPAFKGRMLRLFDRGHKEEFRFVAFLRRIGVEVREYSERLCYHPESDSYTAYAWDAPEPEIFGELIDVTGELDHHERAKIKGVRVRQWTISDVDGHFGGSLDGIALLSADVLATLEQLAGPPPVAVEPSDEINLEFKTHNTKSFCKLVEAGVREAKPEHFAQMQVYMHKRNMRLALYLAVNKNDDDLHAEWVVHDPVYAQQKIELAEAIVRATTAPARIGPNPTWFECKFCDYVRICHYGEKPDRNCRSCKFAKPAPDKQWHCGKWDAIIPVADSSNEWEKFKTIMNGCDCYEPIHD